MFPNASSRRMFMSSPRGSHTSGKGWPIVIEAEAEEVGRRDELGLTRLFDEAVDVVWCVRVVCRRRGSIGRGVGGRLRALLSTALALEELVFELHAFGLADRGPVHLDRAP